MSKTVFDQLMEKLDEVILGRRYIIAEIGKLKEVVSDIQDTSIGNSMSQISNAVNEMKSFMQNSINALTDLKNNITNLTTSVNSLNSTVETTLNAINALQSGGAMPVSAVRPSTTPTSAPTTISTPKVTPAAKTTPAPSPTTTSAAPSTGGGTFDSILSAAKSNTPAVELGNMIDKLRTQLSKENPLNPILFELSMESGRLKALGNNPLNEKNLQTLQEKLQKWKG
ncbi:MAG: hypothetical protein ACTSQJ_17095 [Promethearchaeota archaeon]